MKDFLCFVGLIAAALWFFGGTKPAGSAAHASAPPPEHGTIVVATVSDQRDASWNTTMAEDDAEMARERAQSWQQQTGGVKPVRPAQERDDR